MLPNPRDCAITPGLEHLAQLPKRVTRGEFRRALAQHDADTAAAIRALRAQIEQLQQRMQKGGR